MNDERFQELLQFGGEFEAAVEPKIARVFCHADPLAMLINTATSKTDQKHNRGQRLMFCQDTSASFMLPDVFVFTKGKQFCVEIKCKKRFYRHSDGKLYGVIDSYKVQEYRDAVRHMGFDGIFYVFGDEETRSVYFAKDDPIDIKIPAFREYKNKKGEFKAWLIDDLHFLGKW
ncbi:hypothetical protein PVA23_290 [Vibrio phage PVA23]|nr:hypothetical protein PVA23_290 [Vibrio phage PVA23]